MYYNINEIASENNKRPVGRPLVGYTQKKVVSVRIEEHLIEIIKDDYGSVQKFIDRVVREKIERKKSS